MKKIYVFFILLMLAFPDVHAQYQMLDSTFNLDGIVTTDIVPQSDYINSIALQADQKIVAAGIANNQFAIARYNTDGSLDTTFGTGGFVITPVGAFSGAAGVAIQSDGKIVAGGAGLLANLDFAVVRYHPDGTLDTSFDADGIATVAIGADLDAPRAMLIQPDGKIVLAGRTVISSVPHFALARLNMDGSPDLSFGTAGTVTTLFGATASDIFSIALQTDGKIVAAGSFTSVGPPANDFALARYHVDGSLDTSFGTGGKVITDISGDGDIPCAVVIQPDGKILVAGEVDQGATEEDFGLVRYNTDGTLDTSFGTGGIAANDLFGDNDNPSSMVLQPDGKIIVAGYSYTGLSFPDFILVRYNSDGSLDNSFGTGGILWTDLGTGTNTVGDVKLQADGKIVVGGAINTGTPTSEFALARYVSVLSTGIMDFSESAGSIKIYPNPGNGKFQLSVNGFSLIKSFQLEIYNSLGIRIYSGIQQQITKEIDISKSPKGIYFVKVYDDGKIYTTKIVVE